MPPLDLAEIDDECQRQPGPGLIDRLDMVSYSALPNLHARLTYASDAGPHGL